MDEAQFTDSGRGLVATVAILPERSSKQDTVRN
jgi:hypothetical protein